MELFVNLIRHYLVVKGDSTYMFNLDGLIPKLCLVAQEMGDDERVQQLHSAGLQALSSMVTHRHADVITS